MNDKEFVNQIREEFPFFCDRHDYAVPVYLDNAATTQKPAAVIDRMTEFYRYENTNIHRGTYPLSLRASDAYERARNRTAEWLKAESSDEIVFTKSCTEAINLAAHAMMRTLFSPNDNVVVTELEHSSNYYPWKEAAETSGCEFRTACADEDARITPDQILSQTDEKTKLIAVTGMSNATGFEPDLKELIRSAHERNILVFVDAAQLIAHRHISVQDLGCDFLSFSAHKLYGPMGVGVLYGKKALLETMSPFLYGGNMVRRTGGEISYRMDPGKYEAGTQNIAGVLGLEAALNWLDEQCFEEKLLPYEKQLALYMRKQLRNIQGFREIGCCNDDSPIMTFTMEHIGAYDIGVYLGSGNISVRTGSHCAYPLMKRLECESSVRVSLAFYNTGEEVDLLAERLRKLSRMLCPGADVQETGYGIKNRT